jgi:hypothetical protein
VKGAIGCVVVVLAVGAAAGAGTHAAQAAAWHLDPAFGERGVAGLPVREEGIDFPGPAGPGDRGSLLAQGLRGSLFVGGYADRKQGTFLVACMSARGRLVSSFGRGGVATVPAIYSTPQTPPRMFALSGGGLLIAGLSRNDRYVVARLTARGGPDRAFGHDGVAQYKIPGATGHAIIAAVSVEPDRDILAVTYQREAPQPVNEPMVAPGLGEGSVGLLRLLPSGALDRSFGNEGFLRATGQPPATGEGLAAGVTIAPDGDVLLAYEQAAIPNDNLNEPPAVQELTPSGADAPGFGQGGVAFLPFVPKFQSESSVIFGGLLALPGGGAEVSFGGGGELFRFTPAGTPDAAFGSSGHTTAAFPVSALVLAPDGETFSVGDSGGLTLAGTLASGIPDAALGAKKGMRLAVTLPRQGAREGRRALELLAGGDSIDILLGEEVVRVSR